MQKVKKLVALILMAALIITQLPLTALAQDAEEDEIGIEATENNEASTELPSLQSVPADPGTTVGMWALEKLAGGVVSGVAGKGVNEAFVAIFGSDTAQIFQALHEIKGKLDNIENQIKGLSGKLDEKELRGNLDSFAEFFSDYTTPYNMLCGYQMDYADDAELTDIFMQDLYWGKNRNIDTDGKTVIAAANALGNRITMVLTGGYNVFGAFDKLERHQNRWEHQGYAMRQQYRNYIINVYTLYNAMGQIACEKVIEAHQGDSLSDRNIRMQAQRQLKELQANAKKVDNMNKRCAIVQHPNLRIYRDTTSGTDLYAFYHYIMKSYVPKWAAADLEAILSDDEEFIWHITHTYRMPRDVKSKSSMYLKSDQPGASDFEKIYTDYKKDNGGQAISLYHIFFDEDKGNFDDYAHLPEDTRFATDDYRVLSHMPVSNEHRLSTYVMTNDAERKGILLLVLLSSHRLVDITDEEFFSIKKYTGYLHQGALQSPDWPPASETAGMISGMESSYALPYTGNITLSVEEKVGAAYQWYVARGGGTDYEEIAGKTGATYTLPALEPSMNGWMYCCAIIENPGTDEEIYTVADSVTLRLTGEGVPEPVTIHEIGSANELTNALGKVSDGSWDGHELKLTANIDYSLPITLSGCGLTIDLNGHTLTVQPDRTAQPNVAPMSGTAEIAAVYADNFSRLKLTGDGALNVMAGGGINYGVYAGTGSNVKVNAVTSADGSKAVYATGDGAVTVDSITVAGDNAYGVGCFDSSNIKVSGDVQVMGVSSHGVYIDSESGGMQSVLIGGDVTVNGDKSRGVYLGAEEAVLSVEGSVTVTGGVSGVLAGKGEATIKGDITAPDDAVNAWYGASVTVQGNVVATEKEATAVSSSGADVHIQGNVTSSGQDGMGIYVWAWELDEPAMGANVTVDGKITAATPLRIGSLPVEESEHTETSTKEGYYTFTDGTNTVWAKPGSFGEAVTYTVSIGAMAGGTITASAVTALSGETITLTVIPDEGNRLKLGSLKYNDGAKDHLISGNSFSMPEANVTVAAEFVDASTPVSNHERVMADAAALSIGYAPGDSASAVTQNVHLSVTGAVYGSSITWASSNTAVISNSGVVTRPSFASGNAAVTVTASVYNAVYNAGASSTRDFDLIVLKLPPITYTVTFDKNGGDTQASPSTKEVIAGGNVGTLPMAPTRSGYTFMGWNTQANGSGITFTATTAVTGSITVYAQWSRNSSGGSGGSSGSSAKINDSAPTPKTEIKVTGNTATATITAKATVDGSGNAAATVARTQISDAIGKAVAGAKNQGKGTVAGVEIKVEAPADAAAVETIIPKEAVSQAVETGIGALTISTPVASITFDSKALSTLSGEAAGDVKISASKVEISSLSAEAQRTVGDRPVFDFRVTGGDKTIAQFGGDVSVSVPYTPKEGEDTSAIVIYHINESGALEVVSNCIYDPATGRISFSTRHFSKYAVGYNKITFKDVADGAWYSKAVAFIAAREIAAGTGDGNFSPAAKLTRGQLMVMLMKAYGIAPDANPIDNFTDAGATYYTGYLAAAKRLNIAGGVGNNMFAPNKEITRQEMLTLLHNALKAMGSLPEGTAGKPLSAFTDADKVAPWAKEAITLLVETGTIGGSEGKLSPTSITTRAEMAQILYNLLSK